MGNSTSPARRRPLSVWLLAIGNGLIAIRLIATSFIAEEHGYSSGLAAFYGLTGLAISIAAHATWYGNRIGRTVLLALLTVYFGNTIAYSGWILAQGDLYGSAQTEAALLRIGLSLVWLALNYIFLAGKRARMFFG